MVNGCLLKERQHQLQDGVVAILSAISTSYT